MTDRSRFLSVVLPVETAEELDTPLATLDQRLVRAPGPGCEFRSA